MHQFRPIILGIAMSGVVFTTQLEAATVTSTNSDGFGTSSFNTAGIWDNSLTPSAGNDYVVGVDHRLRSPADEASHVFAGDSLTITALGAENNISGFSYKGIGADGFLTVNNLILDGGSINHISGIADVFNLDGNLSIASDSVIYAKQGAINIFATISGSATIINPGSDGGGRSLSFLSASNTFNGNLINDGRFTLADDATFNFTIAAAGTNNSISGAGAENILNGNFDIDLTAASTTLLDQWNLVVADNVTYGETFTVLGWTEVFPGIWEDPTSSYQFTTSNSTLTVGAADSDGDGLRDQWEYEHFSDDPQNPNPADLNRQSGTDDGFPVADNDGLNNLREQTAGTDPNIADSDNDGIDDGVEVDTHGTLPLVADTDEDGLSDGHEINISGTLPLNPDSDDDGLNDGPEIAAGTSPINDEATAASVIHRYTFNVPAGTANPGSVVTDEIGGANGVIVGANGAWTGNALSVPGGAGATDDAAYVDLPNGILSAHAHVTFEAWYTIGAAQNWGRIWDFGSTIGGELTTGNTGATDGQDYFIYAAQRGGEINQQRLSYRNQDELTLGTGVAPFGGSSSVDSDLVTNLEQEYHVAGVWTSDGVGGGQLVSYRDGVFTGTAATGAAPTDMNDVNNWLGRSNWTGDNYFQGDFNEFRIYEGALNKAAVAASFAAGPDAEVGNTDFQITEVLYDATQNQFTLIWNSESDKVYTIQWGTDLSQFPNDIGDDFDSAGEVTSHGPFDNPSPNSAQIFFRISENQ